jgi:Protein of unknown function (DUF3987)
MTFPNLDREIALRQLALLGYAEGDNVYLRFFYPNDDPRKDTDKGRKSDCLDPRQIEAYQRAGRGVYFVVNGGGHKDENVLEGRAIFVEHDNLDKEIQRELWKTLELPEPTFQVDTGGKSIHSYWVFDQPIEIEKWRSLQRDLLEFTDGDRAIKNPSRVMRLAGAWHISFDESGNPVYNQSLMIFESGKVYTYEEIRAAIPCSLTENSLPLAEPAVIRDQNFFENNFQSVKHPDSLQIPVPAAVPLETCLAKESRYLLEHGIAQGGRNTSGAKLARDLIGTYNYLLSIGQNVDGDPRQLLYNYANRCNPPLDAREVESIWKSANQSHPTPSCGSEGVNNCIKGWYWREYLSKNLTSSGAGFASDSSTSPKERENSKKRTGSKQQSGKKAKIDLSLAWQIDEILDRHLPDSEQDLALVELAKSLDSYNASEIRAIAAKRIEERHRQDNLDERRNDLERLERWESEEYKPFEDLFYDHPQVARAFEHLCRVNKKIQPQYFLGILSPLSSLIGIKGSVNVPVLGQIRSTINLALVGESGAGKSIVSKILLKPLYQLQKELQSAHKQQKEEYESALLQWEKQHPDTRGSKPVEKDFVTTSDAFLVINEYSREGIVKNHADNPNGLLIHQEELVAIQRAQNMYRQGKGDDRQFLNNLYDNATITRALRSERIIVDETAVAIFGGYQPAIVLGEMGDLSDPDGQWARFNFINGIEKRVHTDLNQPTVDLSDFLYSLYRKALFAPTVNCRFEREGIQLLQKFINEMEDLYWRTLQGGLRAVYSKAASEVCRIALGLHWKNSLIGGDTVPEVIPARAVKKAISIKRYFLRQIQIIRTWGEADPKREEGMTPMYREIQKIARRLKGSTKFLTVRMVQQARLTLFKGLNSEGIKKIFQDLAAMGKAKLTNWKRGIALLIDSMEPDNPTSGGDEPSGGNPSSYLSVLKDADDFEKNSSPSVLLKSVGDLLKDFDELNSLPSNGFNSFVESVESVGRCFSIPLRHSADQKNSQFGLIANCEPPRTERSEEERRIANWIDLPTVATNPTVALSIPQTGLEIVETIPTNFQQKLSAQESSINPDVKWLMELLKDLESANRERFPDVAQLNASLSEADLKALLCAEQLKAHCPDYWERAGLALEALALVLDSDSNNSQATPQESNPTQTSLASIKALLLAAQSLSELKTLKKEHGAKVAMAYKASSVSEQLVIDGISANAVPHQVYKYVGHQTINSEGKLLQPGALVYLDPTAKVSLNSVRVPVWLLKGLKLGWDKAIEVSRDCLVEVKKAVAPVVDAVGSVEQPLLFNQSCGNGG